MVCGKKIHFMGIGGIGMSALAAMAARSGAIVSGCDRAQSDATSLLAARGIRIDIGHDPKHVHDADLLVITSAIAPDHPERAAARCPVITRGQLLADFMAGRGGIGIAGTHGKTTTSWLTGGLFMKAGRDPEVFVGGMVPQLPDGNYRLGQGPFVAELDESDGSFLLPRLTTAVLTNCESDHLSHYHTDDALYAAFTAYAAGVADTGLLIAGTESPSAAEIFARHAGRKVSFGLHLGADYRGVPVRGEGNCFELFIQGSSAGRMQTALPGEHNIRNALAAIAAGAENGLDIDAMRAALPGLRGVGRRLEHLGMFAGAHLYSDYAHHPTEMAASIAALRQTHQGRIYLVFQPHLYSRTRDYADAFACELAKADAALVVDIYPAREEPIMGVTSDLLVVKAEKLSPNVFGAIPVNALERFMRQLPEGNFEAIVFMGAGDIDDVARRLCS